MNMNENNNNIDKLEMGELERIIKGLKELDDMERMINNQRKILKKMLNEEDEPIPALKIVVKAIDNYIADKNIAYRVDNDQSNETQMVLTIIDADTDSSAIVRITDLDWM